MDNLTTLPAKKRLSLRHKITGPNALPIAQLVAMGERASARVEESFQQFLVGRVRSLEARFTALANPECGEDAWLSFFTIVRDIRGSSALAKHHAANSFCKSFEILLQDRDRADLRMHDAIRSHINALRLVTTGRAPDEQSRDVLVAQLWRAVNALRVKSGGLHEPPAAAHVL